MTAQQHNITIKKMFYLITQNMPQCNTQLKDITYKFSEASHRKRSADEIGGYLKKNFRRPSEIRHICTRFRRFSFDFAWSY